MNDNFEAEDFINETDIAIIGMAGRFPCANNLEEFWKILHDGRDVIKHFSDEELKNAGILEAVINQPYYIKARGVLDEVEYFDNDFFGISPYEAAITDPQHRLFLEVCWEGLETAGYTPDKYNGLIGVFAGMSDSTYLENNLLKNEEFLKNNYAYQTQIATSSHFLATKVAYHLNLKGPCLNINTACSTSLVAIIKACQSLQINECDMAIAGGVSIRFPQIRGYLYREGGIFSADGKCRAFDAEATGTVSSSAAGIVVLKRLSDAVRAGDKIEAVIKGFAINNDGATKVGYTAPSVLEQSRCIATALAQIDDVRSISYVEAHGTGTPLGDPIEIAALIKAFRHYTQENKFCAIGSVKTNIGHADTAAGVVGLIKTVLALKHKLLPASLYFKQANPKIDFSESPFYVNQVSQDWHTEYPLRRAGVSSFGIGGTNAHIVLEEAPNKTLTSISRQACIISLSARTPVSLFKLKEKFLHYLQQHKVKNSELADIAYTLHIGRKDFDCRKSYIVKNSSELIDQVKSDLDSSVKNLANVLDKKPKIVFLFSGQGTLFSGMAKFICENEPIFRKYINHAANYLIPEHKADILNYVLDPQSFSEQNCVRAYIQQPALFIVEYALAETLIELGIKPDAVIGHSLGEYVAIYFAGALSLRDAIQLVSIRGQLTDMLEPGAMLSVPLSVDEIEQKIAKYPVSIAAINSPKSCVISGESNAIKILEDSFNQNLNYKCTNLNISYAFHSAMVEKIFKQYQTVLNTIHLQPLKIPCVSNVTGEWIKNEDLSDKSYFIKHFRETVLFSKGISLLLNEEYNTFLEIGVGHALTTFIKHHDCKFPLIAIKTIPGKKEFLSDQSAQSSVFQKILASCWENKIAIDWTAYYADEVRQRVHLPTYQFERNRHWIEPSRQLYNGANKLSATAIYQPYWSPAEYPRVLDFSLDKTWLIFSDSLGYSEQLSNYLSERSQKVITVIHGKNFNTINPYHYQINYESKEDYQKLFITLKENNYLPDYVLHCCSLTEKINSDSVSLNNDIQVNGFLSLIYFAQVFLEERNTKQFQIVIVTNYLKAITPDDYIIPEKATMIGVSLVIPQEYQHVNCRIVDVDIINQPAEETEKYLSYLVNEINSNYQEHFVAYRKGIRFVNFFKEYNETKDNSSNFCLKSKGTYLITGGLGKIGLSLAEFLAENYSANLILLARGNVPSQAEWVNELFLPNKSESYKVNIVKLNKISKLATSLSVMQVDVSEYQQMDMLFSELKQKYTKLDGIFHLAGIADKTARNLIRDMTIEQSYRLFLPKIQGTKILQRLINKVPVDFCILYSSLASIVGGIGFASYSASNCYLDSVIDCYKNNPQTYWICINWDAWSFSNESIDKLQPKEGMDLLEKCAVKFMSNRHFIVSKTNLDERLKKWINPKNILFVPKLENNNENIELSSFDVEDELKKIFQKCLGIINVSQENSFYDMGGDSLSAIHLLEMLDKTLSIRIKLSDLVEYNSISKLAELIKSKQILNDHSCVIKIKESGSGPPLFLVHPVGGSIFCYLELAKKYLSCNNPCYAIQDPNMDSTVVSFKSLEEMASYYLDKIQQIQPKGPYFVGGYSLGANVAFEIARQLLDKKMKVGGIFLIDGWASFSSQLKNYDRFCHAMQRTLNELDNNIPGEIFNKNRYLDLAWQRMQLLLNYNPNKIQESSIVLLKAQDVLPEYIEINDMTNHWQEYSIKPVEVHSIIGNHATILKAPGAYHIGKIIDNHLLSAVKLNLVEEEK